MILLTHHIVVLPLIVSAFAEVWYLLLVTVGVGEEHDLLTILVIVGF